MTQKNVFITICVVLALLVVGYFFFLPDTYKGLNNEDLNSTSNASQDAKINIDAVCRDALTFMTFIDGASAELFLTECKEGKHPEVIEEYKIRMGLGAGAEI